MHFQHPIQVIQQLRGLRPKLLIAAVGPRLYTFDTETGSQLTVWPSPVAVSQHSTPGRSPSSPIGENPESDVTPPEKKRRLSPSSSAQTSEYQWSIIPILVATSTGEHVVAVTSEDKCLRVFHVGIDGSLSQLSERCMPKRPCAVSLGYNDNTILCGDKFGDVYSLPLFPKHDVSPIVAKASEVHAPFKPSASMLTVHTKRNLMSLKQQMEGQSTKSEKAGPSFEHKLLLGHVSMLTDLALVALPNEHNPDRSRSYILTADRDEHIRVSRGIPQTHIIHGYCLGHNSFVSRLCVPQWAPQILISGGGDNYILVWDWIQGRIIQKVPLDLTQNKEKDSTQELEVTVTGIWSVPLANNQNICHQSAGVIVVAIEGSPKLLSFIFGKNHDLIPIPPIEVSGNVLDVTNLDDQGNIAISVDNVHEPGSVKSQRKNTPSISQKLLHKFAVVKDSGDLRWDERPSPAIGVINQHGTFDFVIPDDVKEAQTQVQKLGGLLYNVGNLRKRASGGAL